MPTWYALLAQAQYIETRAADRAARYAACANAPTLHLSSTILRKASRPATEEEDSEYSSLVVSYRLLGCQCFVARVYCDGQYFYWATRLVFGNKRGN
jgi:hypothetical protein